MTFRVMRPVSTGGVKVIYRPGFRGLTAGGELGGEGGSILGHDGCWRWSGGPERNVYRGSDDGYPVTAKEARQIIVQLGHAVDVLEEPDVDWPAPERPDEMRRVRGWTVRRAWLAVRARCHSLTGRDMA